jgi:transcriptional regulator with PAS, ATPase and Fis domain
VISKPTDSVTFPSRAGNGGPKLIGTSQAVLELEAEVARVARSDAKVLITGESGVGKELVARTIYELSSRKNAPFVPVNCAGIPETLLESELFGHVKGSFTGAYRDKPGKLEMARDGTIFLDEIGETTLRMQGMLLRFLETGEIQKVGAERMTSAANVRVLAATNRNLSELITEGRFREDLFYRINVIHLVVPPLRTRREDIPLLVEHFLTNFAHNGANGNGASGAELHGHHPPVVRAISRDALQALCEYAWPGNVRQLQNVIERVVVTGRRETIEVDDLPYELRTPTVVGHRPRVERRRTVADVLYTKLVEDRESFWTAVYPLYMNREITRANVRDLVHKGLAEARGNYKIVAKLFNMDERDYKRFLNFLRKHDCQLPFKEYRQ